GKTPPSKPGSPQKAAGHTLPSKPGSLHKAQATPAPTPGAAARSGRAAALEGEAFLSAEHASLPEPDLATTHGLTAMPPPAGTPAHDLTAMPPPAGNPQAVPACTPTGRATGSAGLVTEERRNRAPEARHHVAAVEHIVPGKLLHGAARPVHMD